MSRSRRPALLVPPRPLILVHRWLGICVGFLFAVWFASGAVMSFVPFPSLPGGTRLAHSEAIDIGRVRVSPAAALIAAAGLPVERLRLISVEGHPRYVLAAAGRPVVSVSAESGQLLGSLPANVAREVAESFSGQPAAAISGPFDYDQWIVHDQFDEFRPFYRVTLADGHGTELYVSARSGEVMQRTRRAEREWNYVGSVVHWANIVALRRHKEIWRWVMLALGSTCGLLACAGITLGMMHLINARRMRRPGLSPFRGWLRWHHTLGLFASVLLLSWTVSGCLMLDDGMVFPSDEPTAMEVAGVRGMSLAEAADRFPLPTLSMLPPARQIEVTAVAGTPYLVVRNGAPEGSWLAAPTSDGDRLSLSHFVPDASLLAAVREAWPASHARAIHGIPPDDAYQLLSDPLPRTARRIVLDDTHRTWIRIDSATGRIISVTDSRSRLRRWWVEGLHDLDFPLLDRSEVAHHTVLLLAVALGFVFSCTGLVVAVKRIRRRRA
jgi:hypothetical protein